MSRKNFDLLPKIGFVSFGSQLQSGSPLAEDISMEDNEISAVASLIF